MSFGGPEGPDEVVPFLENVTRGRGIPRERLEAVGAHYMHFGGVSPINGEVRKLIAALEPSMAELGLRVYWGNRNWKPMLDETIARMADDGVRHALAFVTSGFGSYSGCRQYLDDIDKARASVGERAPKIDKLRLYFDHPGFLEPMVDHTIAAIDSLPLDARSALAKLVFTAHSIPMSMSAGAPYVAQLEAARQYVTEAVSRATGLAWPSELAWQSRSGSPQVPWLGPDVGERMTALPLEGVRAAVVVPIGFTMDHIEVLWDLDTEAEARAQEAGVLYVRAATVGQHPRYVKMIRELVEERTKSAPKLALTTLGPAPDVCEAHCCPRPQRPPSR